MDDIFNGFQQSNRKHLELQSRNAESYKDASRERLSRIINKKFETAIIGMVSSVEKHLGYLWAHGEKDSSLNDVEIRFREIWSELRNEILTKGNNQRRAAELEISEYNVEWKKKDYKFDHEGNPSENNRNNWKININKERGNK